MTRPLTLTIPYLILASVNVHLRVPVLSFITLFSTAYNQTTAAPLNTRTDITLLLSLYAIEQFPVNPDLPLSIDHYPPVFPESV